MAYRVSTALGNCDGTDLCAMLRPAALTASQLQVLQWAEAQAAGLSAYLVAYSRPLNWR